MPSTLRAVRAQPDVLAALRHHPDRARHRRAGRHGAGLRVRDRARGTASSSRSTRGEALLGAIKRALKLYQKKRPLKKLITEIMTDRPLLGLGGAAVRRGLRAGARQEVAGHGLDRGRETGSTGDRPAKIQAHPTSPALKGSRARAFRLVLSPGGGYNRRVTVGGAIPCSLASRPFIRPGARGPTAPVSCLYPEFIRGYSCLQ